MLSPKLTNLYYGDFSYDYLITVLIHFMICGCKENQIMLTVLNSKMEHICYK